MWKSDKSEIVSNIIAIVVKVLIIVLILSFLSAFPVMWLWNWLMPVIFNLPTITVWQALGLELLIGLLWGGRYYYNNK